MVLTLLAIWLPAALLMGWLCRRMGPVPSWGALGTVGIATFLPSYFPIGSVALLSPTGRFLIWSGLDKEAHPYASRLVDAFLSAAIPEEVYKFVCLLLACYWIRKRCTVQAGILLGAMAGIGHALGENCQDIAEGVRAALISGLLKLIYLAALGILMGFLVGKAQSPANQGRRLWARALLIPVILHGLFDFGYFVGELAEPYTDRDLPAPIMLCLLEMFVIWFVPIVWAGRILRQNRVRTIVTSTGDGS